MHSLPLDPQSLNNKAYPQAAAIPTSLQSQVDDLLNQHKLSTEEFFAIQRILQRLPTMAELGVFSAMWSEHCSYKSSRRHLRRLPTQGAAVVVGPGENAGIVRLWQNLCLAFKMESHNHPSFIAPYQGAATGVGGILRDVFCMGARPIALLNALRFGELDNAKARQLLEGVVKGIGDYGNCVGIADVGGSFSCDPSYEKNNLVNAMAIGLIREDAIFKGTAAGPGNLVMYVGSATGRDGIHGATMASACFDSDSQQNKHTVQVGDPFAEKLLLEATLEALAANLVVGLQDMGAAGLTSSLMEMAERGQCGLFIDLGRVPVRSAGMTAYELLLSESQERMAMVVEAHLVPELERIFQKWQLEYAVIGQVTTTQRVQVVYEGKLEVDIGLKEFAAYSPELDRPTSPRRPRTVPAGFAEKVPAGFAEGDPRTAFAALLPGDDAQRYDPTTLLAKLLRANPAKKWVYEQFDSQIGGRTVHGPKQQGAAVLWIQEDLPGLPPYLGVAAVATCLERYCRIDPFAGAAHSVLKAARSLFAAGATPLAITDCLNYGNPTDPEIMWEFSQGIDGIALACTELQIPVISGNVSFYNETDGKSIVPTPMIGMVGRVDDVRASLAAIPQGPAYIYALRPHGLKGCYGGSLLAKALGLPLDQGELPPLLWKEEKTANTILQHLMQHKALSALRAVDSGGILFSLVQMALASGLGFELSLPFNPEAFSESAATYLLLSDKSREELQKLIPPAALALFSLSSCGTFTVNPTLNLQGQPLDRSVLQKAGLTPSSRAGLTPSSRAKRRILRQVQIEAEPSDLSKTLRFALNDEGETINERKKSVA